MLSSDVASLSSLLPAAPEAAVFATAVLVLNATPGVDFLLTVSRTLQGGARAGLAAALGISTGCGVHALAAAFGLAAVLAVHRETFVAIQWAGAAYLVWLGVGMWRQAWQAETRMSMSAPGVADVPEAPEARVGAASRGFALEFRTGVLTNVLNPKVALFFLAFLPQFVPVDTPSQTQSFLLLGAWFIVQGTVFLLALVALAAQLQKLGVSGTAARVLRALGGSLFVALAWRIVKERPVGT